MWASSDMSYTAIIHTVTILEKEISFCRFNQTEEILKVWSKKNSEINSYLTKLVISTHETSIKKYMIRQHDSCYDREKDRAPWKHRRESNCLQEVQGCRTEKGTLRLGFEG